MKGINRKSREGKRNGRVEDTKGNTRSSAIAEGLREALVSRNPATTTHLTRKPYRVALFA